MIPNTLPVIFSWSEPLGLSHRPQVVEISAPTPLNKCRSIMGTRGAIQPSRQDPSRAFLHLSEGVAAGACLSLTLGDSCTGPLRCTRSAGVMTLDNGRCAIRLPDGDADHYSADGIHPGPVLGVRVGADAGLWRGSSFLDTRSNHTHLHGDLLEEGPLRAVHRVSINLGDDRWYTCTATLDADADFVRIEESFAAGEDDQVVWDFTGADLPTEVFQLDAGAGHTVIRPEYTWAHSYARIWGWSQCSQLREDGAGLALTNGDVVGFVALEGGAWRGGERNQLECWSRRWRPDTPRARRLLPDYTADAVAPDGIPARGAAVHHAHLSVEGWIRGGQRVFALVLASRHEVDPPGGPDHGEPIGPWESVANRARFQAQQGLLRRIHTQHGVMPLQQQLSMTFAWDDQPTHPVWPHDGLRDQGHAHEWAEKPDPDVAIAEWLETRIAGFWYASGLTFCNVVAGRPLAPLMLLHQHRVAMHHAAQALRTRTAFAFITYLYANDSFYPVDATMLPVGHEDGSEPLLAGMANQNFATDALVVPGTFGAIFPNHPAAATWRARADRQWARQMEFHCYPESGLWEESHTYYCHVLATIYPWLLAKRQAGFGDGFGDVALHRLVESALLQLAPRDANIASARWLIPIGDHGADPVTYRWLAQRYAEALVAHHGTLAGHLAWLHHEAGGAQLTHPTPRPFPWRSGAVQGLGYFLRNGDHSQDESLLFLRAGGAWAHHHADNGCVWLYAAGRGLITDMAGSEIPASGASKFSADSHSRWLPKNGTPIDVLWHHHRGWIQAADDHALHPWAIAWCPVRCLAGESLARRGMRGVQHLASVIRHQRLTMRLGATTWLVIDRTPDIEGRARFHVTGQPQIIAGGVQVRWSSGLMLWLAPLEATSETASVTLGVKDNSTRRPDLVTTAIDIVTRPGWSALVIAIGENAPGSIAMLAANSWKISTSDASTTAQAAATWLVACDGEEWSISGPSGSTRLTFPSFPRQT